MTTSREYECEAGGQDWPGERAAVELRGLLHYDRLTLAGFPFGLAGQLEPGKRYRLTVEEIGRESE